MTTAADEAQIRALIEAWAAAVRQQDLGGVLAKHSSDIVMFDVPLPLQSIGMQEYEKTWELFFEHSAGGPGSFDVTELRISAGDTRTRRRAAAGSCSTAAITLSAKEREATTGLASRRASPMAV